MGEFNATKYKNDFNKTAYDRVSINFPKGQKEIIEEYWKARGYKSLNAYVNDLIKRDMAQNATSIKNSNNVIIGNSGSIHME